LEGCDAEVTEKAAAEKWRVSAKWIQKVKKRRREPGSLEPIKGKPSLEGPIFQQFKSGRA
jgi:hypothetical protein